MKKILIICSCIMLSIFITACSNNSHTIENQILEDETSVFGESVMPQESSTLEPDSSNQVRNQDEIVMDAAAESIDANTNDIVEPVASHPSSISVISNNQAQNDTVTNTTPDYPAQIFRNIDELITWVENENVETYQEGRFKNSVSSLKSLKKVFSPSYSNPDIALRCVELLPDSYNPDGSATVVYYYFLGDERVVIEAKQMNETYAKQANEKGISGYMEAKYGSRFKNAQVYKADVATQNGLTKKRSTKSVPYVKTTIESEGYENPRTQIAFLSDGFEVNIYKQEGADDNIFIDEICLESVSLNK